MIRILMLLCAAAVSSAVASAQMTVDQKVSDFTQLASTYARAYGPYEWKVQTQNFDLFKVKTWLDRVKASKDDLEFMDICVEYVASLNDAHDMVTITSDYYAYLGFSVDLYDGVYLIDDILRTQLRATVYPFQIGDELVSIDGVTTAAWVKANSKYGIGANPRSTARLTADVITFRPQATVPGVVNLPDRAVVVIKRQSGALESYTIPWAKGGTPVYAVGPVPGLNFNASKSRTPKPRDVEPTGEETDVVLPDVDLPPVLSHALTNMRLPAAKMRPEVQAYLGVGEVPPIFTFPTGFTQRLGRSFFDYFASGTVTINGTKVGYIRIPDFLESTSGSAVNSFVSEITYMQANTDGLIIDVMRNFGGNGCYAEQLLSAVIPTKFRTLGFEIRPSANLIDLYSQTVDYYVSVGAEPWIVKTYQSLLTGIKKAYSENRGRTGPIPLCYPSLDIAPLTDRTGKVVAYSKPLMVAVDEFSVSSAELFAAVVQDNQRGLIYGMRTMGGGGNVTPSPIPATTFSELSITLTESLMNRKNPIATTDYPTAPYVENIGIRPDIQADYMTKDNLLNRGKTFSDAMFAAAADYFKKGQ